MGKVIVTNYLTLDGVMQAPGRADEDTRDGFEHGGWAAPYGDEATVAKMGERMGSQPTDVRGASVETFEHDVDPWSKLDLSRTSRFSCRLRGALTESRPSAAPGRRTPARTELCH